MNIEQAKQIPIEVILKSMGLHPEKEAGNDIWFRSPFSPTEKSPSFHLNKQNGYWYCFSSGIGGRNGIDLIVKVKKCTVSEALSYLQSFDSFSFQKQTTVAFEKKKQESENTVITVKNIEHIALKQYLVSRGITSSDALNQVKEVHYQVNGKNYFGIGFTNKSTGFELRSKYVKICIGKKDITLIDNKTTLLRAFEGFIDYLSFIQISDEKTKKESDYLILNSAALIVKNIALLDHYETIQLYLDNDSTGEKYTKLILEKYENAIDCRSLYNSHKDLNEWLAKS